MLKKFRLIFICALILLAAFASASAAGGNGNIIGSWETAVEIDGEQLVTRVNLDKDGELSIKLREFMEFLGYGVSWNDARREVTAQKGDERIIIPIGLNRCNNNGSLMYLKTPAYIDYDHSYLPLSFIQNILGISAVEIDSADPPSHRVNGLRLITVTTTPADLQRQVDEGHQPWRLVPEEVAIEFASRVLGFKGEATLAGPPSGNSARVGLKTENGQTIIIDLCRPAKRGEDGIWAAEHWFDESNRCYRARDLSRLPAPFHNEDGLTDSQKEIIAGYLVDKWSTAYEKYYDILGFEAAASEIIQKDGRFEMKFLFSMACRNYYRDPATVAYIIEAGKTSAAAYERLCEEYNLANIINFDLKITAGLTADGSIDPASIEIFHNSSTDSEEYRPLDPADFFPSN